jgi:hypothetical protein
VTRSSAALAGAPRAALFAIVWLFAIPARAHHEAIFGPQSSLVMSAPAFISTQVFSRRLETQRQETTLVLSGSITPVAEVPLSLTAIVPYSVIDGAGQPSRAAFEDSILGARYRFDLSPLQAATGKEGNFLLGMGAVELPTGSMDHASFSGPVGSLAALLWSGEVGAFSAIAYGFYRHPGDASDARPETLFLGGGVAWTPIDDPVSERIFSLQLGYSHERSFSTSVATAQVLHPTIVFAPVKHLLGFAVVSIPVSHDGTIGEQDQWRIGGGAVFLFGGGH